MPQATRAHTSSSAPLSLVSRLPDRIDSVSSLDLSKILSQAALLIRAPLTVLGLTTECRFLSLELGDPGDQSLLRVCAKMISVASWLSVTTHESASLVCSCSICTALLSRSEIVSRSSDCTVCRSAVTDALDTLACSRPVSVRVSLSRRSTSVDIWQTQHVSLNMFGHLPSVARPWSPPQPMRDLP